MGMQCPLKPSPVAAPLRIYIVNLMGLIQTMPAATADGETGCAEKKKMKTYWRSRLDLNALSDLQLVQLQLQAGWSMTLVLRSDCLRSRRTHFMERHCSNQKI